MYRAASKPVRRHHAKLMILRGCQWSNRRANANVNHGTPGLQFWMTTAILDEDQKDEIWQHDACNDKMPEVRKADCSASTYRDLVLLDCICKLQGLRLAHLALICILPHLCQTPVVCSTQHITLSHSGEEGCLLIAGQ